MSSRTASVPMRDLLLADFDGAWGDEPAHEVGTPVIRSTDMRGGKLNLESPERRSIPLSVIKKKRLQNGDILVTKSSGSAHLVGASVLFAAPEGETYLCSNFTRCLRPNPGQVEPDFLYFGLQSPQFKEQVFGAQRTTSGLRNLKIEEFKSGKLRVPSLSEQRRIVNRIKKCLSRIEEIETLRTEALSEANALLPSMLNDAFARLEAEYGAAEIGELAEETRYGTSSKCTSTPNGIPILRIPNVAGGFVNVSDLKYCSLDKRDLDKLRLRRGDLLFVRTNGSRDLVGRCAIFEGCDDSTFAFASYLIRVRLTETRMRPHFLSFYLNSTHGREELDKRRRTSAGQYNINSENLRSIEVPVPPLKMQDDLIGELRLQQDAVVALRNSIIELQDESSFLRESILRKAFAGEL